MIKHKNSGQLIVISAPSGSGKGTIISKLLEHDNKNRWLSVSTTSRAPRTIDIPGETYNFVTKEEFERYKKVLIASIVMASDDVAEIASEIIDDYVTWNKIIPNKIELVRNMSYNEFNNIIYFKFN